MSSLIRFYIQPRERFSSHLDPLPCLSSLFIPKADTTAIYLLIILIINNPEQSERKRPDTPSFFCSSVLWSSQFFFFFFVLAITTSLVLARNFNTPLKANKRFLSLTCLL
uniref:Uncharacterized protein n=1 Tax=Trypanosoma vivax (strain Y486) TaxID=1055687 RepID=G0TT86_TRYVY|nr:hypothetical protein TVY486_0303430 [Trypanosoma vivax Y486]